MFRWRLSLFEKVILTNTLILLAEATAAFWVTSHALESHHYLIDTAFLVLAALLSIGINVMLLRASFGPLFNLLRTMREVSAGAISARTTSIPPDSEIGELAQAFNTMLDHLESLRKEQAALILQAHEEEQRRLSLELHDESSQNLTALLVYTEVLSQSFQNLPDATIAPGAREQLGTGFKQLTSLAQQTLDNIRMLSQQLRPGVLDDLGLLAALRWLVEDSRQRLRLDVELSIDAAFQVQPFPKLYEATLFRIAQECLTNVARHAQARHVTLILKQQSGNMCLCVQDDGCGYDPTRSASGLGLFGIRERATLLGGSVTISSEPGEGTLVKVLLPLLAENGTQERVPFPPDVIR